MNISVYVALHKGDVVSVSHTVDAVVRNIFEYEIKEDASSVTFSSLPEKDHYHIAIRKGGRC